MRAFLRFMAYFLMRRGPQGRKRPADVIGAAITVAKIATGEIKESKPSAKETRARKGGLLSNMPSLGVSKRSAPKHV